MIKPEKEKANKGLNGKVATVGLNAQDKTECFKGGVVSANSVSDIRKGIVTVTNVNQPKNQIQDKKEGS